ncbi:MAG: BCD family MFS transporter [Methylobacterium sp.]|nr:BCD family MFS transporter [Methylobacterium sp.]
MKPLGWLGILRLGLVQTALGAIVVLTTSTINRVMVVELALPAMLPGLLVGLHYAVQVLRPHWGHGADVGGRLTPWILGGMATLALGGFGAALGVVLMQNSSLLGLLVSTLAFLMIGIGVGASGTSLLVLLSKRVEDKRRPAAATIVWVMMIIGFIVTAATAGHFLDPFSFSRLLAVSGMVSALAFLVSGLAVWGVEGAGVLHKADDEPKIPFREAIAEVWAEPHSRLFAIFIFLSMVAYSAQDLILEPFAGVVFGLTPGETTRLAGLQHAGVLAGMILVGLVSTVFSRHKAATTRFWTVGGCLASALALAGLVASAIIGMGFPFRPNVFLLGLANGAFAAAAIGAMMRLVNEGNPSRAGIRMGLWGAAQGIAFGAGGLVGAMAADIARFFIASQVAAYAVVFAAEGVLFLVSAVLADRIARQSRLARGLAEQPRKEPDISGLALGR